MFEFSNKKILVRSKVFGWKPWEPTTSAVSSLLLTLQQHQSPQQQITELWNTKCLHVLTLTLEYISFQSPQKKLKIWNTKYLPFLTLTLEYLVPHVRMHFSERKRCVEASNEKFKRNPRQKYSCYFSPKGFRHFIPTSVLIKLCTSVLKWATLDDGKQRNDISWDF